MDHRMHWRDNSHDDSVRVWDTHTMKQVALLRGHTFKVSAVAFSKNGVYIASGRGARYDD